MSNSELMHSLISIDIHTKEGRTINDPMQRRHYRSIIGDLLYLAVKSRPDVGAAVSMLSAFVKRL